MFYDDPRVLYISLHRYDGGTFFPGKTDANHDFTGSGPGKGYNINVAWNSSGMGDPEYALAFFGLILPVAYQFSPDLILVSSGFDAARGDALGRCKLSPEFYGFMTHQLTSLANGKVIVALEGKLNWKKDFTKNTLNFFYLKRSFSN
jgi:histone deacetylase 6